MEIAKTGKISRFQFQGRAYLGLEILNFIIRLGYGTASTGKAGSDGCRCPDID
jgi:hypothetical protein